MVLKSPKRAKKIGGLKECGEQPREGGGETMAPSVQLSLGRFRNKDEGPPHTGRGTPPRTGTSGPKARRLGADNCAESTPSEGMCTHCPHHTYHLERPATRRRQGAEALARRANITPMDNHGPVVPENLAQIIPHGPDEPGPALGPHSQGRDVALPGSI